jgi:hypothetical protein
MNVFTTFLEGAKLNDEISISTMCIDCEIHGKDIIQSINIPNPIFISSKELANIRI